MSSGLLMLCPTRGRPVKAARVLQTFRDTRRLVSTTLLFVVDEDDPLLDDYDAALPAKNLQINEDVGSMSRALNSAATLHAAIGLYDYLGFMGDDHRFRTSDWDATFVAKLIDAGGGFAYGDDLLQGANLPTHVVMDTSIVSALGWMALPTCRHLFLDDCWKALGEATGRLFYLPEVVIEHMHPFLDKAPMDAGYERVNSQETVIHDLAAFTIWQSERANLDIEKIKRVLE